MEWKKINMNKTLLTIKDLKEYVNVKSVGGEFQHGWNNALDEARLQAIKHAKFLGDTIRNGLLEPELCITLSPATTSMYMHQIAWIRYYFNITEEDLKNG